MNQRFKPPPGRWTAEPSLFKRTGKDEPLRSLLSGNTASWCVFMSDASRSRTVLLSDCKLSIQSKSSYTRLRWTALDSEERMEAILGVLPFWTIKSAVFFFFCEVKLCHESISPLQGFLGTPVNSLHVTQPLWNWDSSFVWVWFSNRVFTVNKYEVVLLEEKRLCCCMYVNLEVTQGMCVCVCFAGFPGKWEHFVSVARTVLFWGRKNKKCILNVSCLRNKKSFLNKKLFFF